jgi:hypothetical protein
MAKKYSDYIRDSRLVVDGRFARWAPPSPLTEVCAPLIDSIPRDLKHIIERQFWQRYEECLGWSDRYEVQHWLADQVSEFRREKVHRAFDEPEICALAKKWSELCLRMTQLNYMQEFARMVGVDPPIEKGAVTRAGAIKRLQTEIWWRRQIRKRFTRRAESHLRGIGLVHKHKQLYASDRQVAHYAERQLRNKQLLQKLVAVSDAGDQLALWDIVQKSQANPQLRRNELMVRARGFEEFATEQEHVADFWTVTAPSAFHRSVESGARNPHWRGAAPREAQQWLCKIFARVRSQLKREGLLVYGIRVAEPHHDGTPHWHLLLFMARADQARVREIITDKWLAEYADERGAQDNRVKVKAVVREKGSAAGYIAKYIAKNIDGFAVGVDDESRQAPATETASRVTAWASAHGIRQFQTIGGPSISVWRELRRLRSVCDVEQIENARVPADVGEWHGFIQATGGITSRGRNHPRSLRIWSARTGELTRYEEVRQPQIIGVMSLTHAVQTRVKNWIIKRAEQCTTQYGNSSPITDCGFLSPPSCSTSLAQHMRDHNETQKQKSGGNWKNPHENKERIRRETRDPTGKVDRSLH